MNEGKMPGWILSFLKWFCPDHLYEGIEGDLLQKYNRNKAMYGERGAMVRLIWNSLGFLRPGILSRNNFSLNPNLMFRNHVKVTFRQAMRNKVFSFINAFGLITGITVCLFVAQFVWFEWSFENFNKNADHTYRINLSNTSNGVFTQISPGTVSGLRYAVRQNIPGIEYIARLSAKATGVVTRADKKLEYLENDIVFADPSIVEVLAVDLLKGDKNKILKRPHAVVISKSIAQKYFGEIEVIGKVLEVGFNNGSSQKTSYQIEGVFNDIPENSHQHFDFILPPDNQQAWDENWAWSNVATYAVIPANINLEIVSIGLSEIVKKYHQDGKGDKYLLEPISRIRLYALDGSGRKTLVHFFILLGVVILLLAWFNYINLSTARFFERMKEVGLRKIIGASRVQLVLQLLTESFIVNIISFSGALLVFFLCWPWFTNLIEQPIPTTLFNEPWAFVLIIGFIVGSTICTGFYPSLFLSSFNPLQSIKGKISTLTDRATVRKTLIVVQFAVTVFLITCVLAIQRQIKFMRSQNLGISIDQTLIVEAPLMTDATTVQKFEPFKNEVLQLPGVLGVTYASSFPGKEIDWHRSDITLGQENADYKYSSRIVAVGTEFLELFGLELLAGRNFKSDIEEDKKTLLLNEKACKMFGFSTSNDALNKLIFIGNRRFEVIGVLKDYHFQSLQYQLQPMLYMQGYPRNPAYAIKIAGASIAESIAKIESKWKEAYEGNVFNYSFLNESFERQYDNEKKAGVMVAGLTFLAIVISCSGLFGLSLYAVGRRTKEIGIRKVLGATVSNVVALLSRDFIGIIIFAVIITVPLAHYAIQRWLQGYAYKMPLDAWLFITPVVAVLILTLVSISFQTIGAAKKNPVDSMKYE